MTFEKRAANRIMGADPITESQAAVAKRTAACNKASRDLVDEPGATAGGAEVAR
jgi:hypothetical protein